VHAIRPCPTTADEGSSLVMVARRAG